MLEIISSPYLGFVGLVVCSLGTIAVIAILIVWAADKVIKLIGFQWALFHAYQRYLQDKEASHGE